MKRTAFICGLMVMLVLNITACSQLYTNQHPEITTQITQTHANSPTQHTLSLQSSTPSGEVFAHLWLEGGFAFANTNQVGVIVIPDENKPQLQTEIQAYETGQNPLYLTVNKAGNLLGWVSNETEIMTWRINGAAGPLELPGPELPVTSLAISPDGGELAYAALDGTIAREPVFAGAQSSSEWTAPHWLANLSYSPDGEKIGGADLSGFKVYVFNLNGTQISTFEWTGSVAAALYGVYFSPDWSTLAWVSGNAVQLMDMVSGQTTHLLNHEDAVSYAVWSPNSKWFATASITDNEGSLTPVVNVWNPASGKIAASFLQEFPVQSVSFSPGGNEISVLDSHAFIRIFSLP